MMETAAINVGVASLNSYVSFSLHKKPQKNYTNYVFLQSHFDALALNTYKSIMLIQKLLLFL